MTLKVNEVRKSFGENKVLKGISLEARSGCALGVLGRNGAGKTTLIRIIMKVFPSDSGEVTLDGKAIDRDKIRIGYLPEERGMYPKKKVIDQLVYFGILAGLSRAQAAQNAQSLLARLQMSAYAGQKLMTLSKGNQQKIQLAATLIADPDMVVLDEPFSGLDPVNAMLLKELVRELIDKGKIVLFSSHQMNYIEEFCDEIAILNNGVIAVEGRIKDIRRSYGRNRFVIVTGEADEAESKLRSALGEKLTACEKTNDGLRVTLESDEDKGALFTAAAQSGVEFDSIYIYEPSLSEIFVEYTAGEGEKE